MSTIGGFFEEGQGALATSSEAREDRMNARLEQYLVEAESGLKALTPAERSAELMELRAHLEALTQAERELGMEPELAAQAAMAQFGSAREVTDEIVRVNREQKTTPPRQLFYALLTSVIGAVLSYFAYAGTVWSHEVSKGVFVIIPWASGFVAAVAPLLLGTMVGKLFPRALHARLPLGVAALTWLVSLITPFMNGLTLSSLFTNPDIFFANFKLNVFTANTFLGLVQNAPQAVYFLLMAWAAQSVARRPITGGVKGWFREVVRRVPDTWIGGLGIGTGLTRLIQSLTSLFWWAVAGVPRAVPSEVPLASVVATSVIAILTAIAVGYSVGVVAPKRGWKGLLVSAGIWIPFLISGLSSSQIPHSSYIFFMTAIFALGEPLIAYLVGKRRSV